MANTRAISTLTIILIAIIAAASLVVAIVVWWWFDSENLVSKQFSYPTAFENVKVGNAFDVKIILSSSSSVDITASEFVDVSISDKNEYERRLTLNYIQVSIANETLVVGLKSGYNYRSTNLLRPLTLRAEIRMPDPYELKFSGATHGTVEGFSFSHTLSLVLSGASYLDVVDVSAGDMEILLSGASHLNGKGSANDLFTSTSGASHLDLTELTVRNADIILSGASWATINLDGRLDADLSGASHLRYIGNPIMGTIQTSGESTMEQQQ